MNCTPICFHTNRQSVLIALPRPHLPECLYANLYRFYSLESQALVHLGCHSVKNVLPAKMYKYSNFVFSTINVGARAKCECWTQSGISLTSPISPLPSDSSVTRRISPPDRSATSPKEPPIEVSFSSISWSPNQIKYSWIISSKNTYMYEKITCTESIYGWC